MYFPYFELNAGVCLVSPVLKPSKSIEVQPTKNPFLLSNYFTVLNIFLALVYNRIFDVGCKNECKCKERQEIIDLI